ncbi:hypothetical protein B9Z55_010304 [Caenorhabditis nigoni]|nr:hypothetical protein B9Z55_010304 [Caenorhabditis nigoni]
MDFSQDVIRFIYDGIKDFKNPENLVMWAEEAKMEIGVEKPAKALYNAIWRRLQKIEKLRGFTLKEKAHLLFIFSVPLSLGIAEEMRKEHWLMDLDDDQRIKWFKTEEGVVYQAVHSKTKKSFKGVLLNDKTKKSDIDGSSIETARVQEESDQLGLDDVLDVEKYENEKLITDDTTENSQQISILQWILQIEKFAKKLQMTEEFQTKTKRAVFLLGITDEMVPYRDFNDIFRVTLRSITKEIKPISYGHSLNLRKLLMQIKDNLESSFGYESMKGAMEVIREECEKLGEEDKDFCAAFLATYTALSKTGFTVFSAFIKIILWTIFLPIRLIRVLIRWITNRLRTNNQGHLHQHAMVIF